MKCCHIVQALTELQQKFEGFQTDLDVIKKHLKVPITDSCSADWTTSGTYSSAHPPSACIWVLGGYDGSDFMSDSRMFNTRRYVQPILVLASLTPQHLARYRTAKSRFSNCLLQ